MLERDLKWDWDFFKTTSSFFNKNIILQLLKTRLASKGVNNWNKQNFCFLNQPGDLCSLLLVRRDRSKLLSLQTNTLRREGCEVLQPRLLGPFKGQLCGLAGDDWICRYRVLAACHSPHTFPQPIPPCTHQCSLWHSLKKIFTLV